VKIRHRKMESTGGNVAGINRIYTESEKESSLCRSHSDSYKRRLMDEQTLRATMSTDEIEKLRVSIDIKKHITRI